MERISEKRYPLSAKDYKLYEEVGEGVSASVYRALCIPLNEIVAIKVLDLEKCNNDLVRGVVPCTICNVYCFQFPLACAEFYCMFGYYWSSDPTLFISKAVKNIVLV
jgi:serine/threonine protein kinase